MTFCTDFDDFVDFSDKLDIPLQVCDVKVMHINDCEKAFFVVVLGEQEYVFDRYYMLLGWYEGKNFCQRG